MSNKKNSFSAKGYYIALVLCAAAIGVSGYLYYSNGNEKTADVPAAVTQQELPETAATAPAMPSSQPQNAPQFTGRLPTNLPVWPFMANIRSLSLYLVLRIQTGSKA